MRDDNGRSLCAGALYLFPDPGARVRSMHEALEPGGLLVCATYLWGKWGRIIRAQELIARNPDFHWFTREELAGLFAPAGFSGFAHQGSKVGIAAGAVRER